MCVCICSHISPISIQSDFALDSFVIFSTLWASEVYKLLDNFDNNSPKSMIFKKKCEEVL